MSLPGVPEGTSRGSPTVRAGGPRTVRAGGAPTVREGHPGRVRPVAGRPRPADTGSVRPATATAAAVTTLIGVGAAAVAGRYASDVALKVPSGRPLPGDPRLTVHATEPERITLTRSLASLRPGTYGIEAPGLHAVIGPVLDRVPHTADSVVRRLERVELGVLGPGARVRLTPSFTAAHRSAPSGSPTRTSRSPASSALCPAGSWPPRAPRG